MKTIIFVFFYLITCQESLAFLFREKPQINKNGTNLIDSLGFKQGIWVDFEARPKTAGFTIHDLEDGTSEFEENYIEKEFNILKFCGKYKDGNRIGIWLIFTISNNLLFEINYVDGKIKGNYIAYFKNGDVLKCQINKEQKTRIEIFSKDNILKKTDYYPTKKLLEFVYK